MAERHLTENHLTENHRKETNCLTNQGKDKKFLQVFILIALPLVWAGYAFAIYNGNESNISTYSLLIVAFSLINFNVLCGTEKIENKILSLLARLDSVLFFTWTVITIISIFLK